uniref:Uncharacterized protein n=1 Tax=Utricularia reniformis TaxID=192314 RepID=A0A1Y0B2R3_9LAMI|nr:hypothetical protein AEK19_MT1447 [Utricularia reniformis]ART31639.1 hypothetical protein AEK19_MT1447 [Utricularia reniformis]
MQNLLPDLLVNETQIETVLIRLSPALLSLPGKGDLQFILRLWRPWRSGFNHRYGVPALSYQQSVCIEGVKIVRVSVQGGCFLESKKSPLGASTAERSFPRRGIFSKPSHLADSLSLSPESI